jgi:hypothetical protein
MGKIKTSKRKHFRKRSFKKHNFYLKGGADKAAKEAADTFI